MSSSISRWHGALAVGLVAALGFGFTPLRDATDPSSTAFAPQLITVDTPTADDKALLQTLGLDLTEHAGHDYVEVVLHSAAQAQLLEASGFAYDVRIADLNARQAERRELDAAYAAAVDGSPLPSERETYRSLQDYLDDMAALAGRYPTLARPITVGESVEGRPIAGIEITKNVHDDIDGRPAFLMFGLHHAREWPSGEHTIEFAFDLLRNYASDPRIRHLVNRSRIILVPVSNPDGFTLSYESGQIVDLSGTPVDEVEDGLVTILATPGNAYKRKNCRIIDGQDPVASECTAASSPGGFGTGIDLNRNYGALWGGPGASDLPADPTYRGPEPFSEPETQAIRALISTRQVTTVITNHTFGDLILRPNGVNPQTIAPDGFPVGFAPDEHGMKELGAKMAAQNGYQNIHGWELYDTTGTTEDYSYNATGGYGYTFEIGEHEFHPPFAQVVDEYLGAGEFEGKGNREAYLIALENAVDASTHSVIEGAAPLDAVLRLRRTSSTPTWDPANDFTDSVETVMNVGSTGRFTWHVNPSTRPFVQSRQVLITEEQPAQSQTFEGTVTEPVVGTAEHQFTLEADATLLEVVLDWPTPDDLDLVVYKVAEDGSRTEVASSGNLPSQKERALVQDPTAGRYVLEVINFASATPTYTLTASAFEAESVTLPRLFETWTLTCEVDGEVLDTVAVLIERGEHAYAALPSCERLAPPSARGKRGKPTGS